MVTEAREACVIDVAGLRNQFGSHVVHENLDLQVRQGEILTIVGGSGSGKSVLLRSIVGLHRPSAGRILVNGINLLEADDQARIGVERGLGVLFQKGALYSSLTVAENIMLPLTEHLHFDAKDARELACMKLALVGLSGHIADNPVQSLSGGMVKRVALARALALDPDLLFLDEPTAGLDPISAAAFDDLLATLQQALGLTVVLVTHDLDTLHALSDRVAVLAEKRVLVVDTVDTVAAYDNPWINEYFNGPRGRAVKGER